MTKLARLILPGEKDSSLHKCIGYSLRETDWFWIRIRNVSYGLGFSCCYFYVFACSRFMSSSIKQYLLNFKRLLVISNDTRIVRFKKV